MRKKIVLIGMILVWAISPMLRAESIMELLINKDWREVNNATQLIYQDTMVYYTGTQRITVRLLKYDNASVNIQEYYLSDSMVQVFDTAQVGKHKNGKFIVFRDVNGPDRKAKCMLLTGLSDFTHELIVENGERLQKKKFVAGSTNLKLRSGEIVARDWLLSKTWQEIDIATGQAKNSQEVFMKNVVLKSTFTGDRFSVAPLWSVSEYCFSDTIVKNTI